MGKRLHRPCHWRNTPQASGASAPIVHKPCKYRRREDRGGGKADWCHAIGAFERGDLPCEYCVDKKNERKSE